MRRIIYQGCRRKPRENLNPEAWGVFNNLASGSCILFKLQFGWEVSVRLDLPYSCQKQWSYWCCSHCLPVFFPVSIAFSSHVSWKRLLSRVRRPSAPLVEAQLVVLRKLSVLSPHETFRFPRLVCRFHGRASLDGHPCPSPVGGFTCWTPLPLFLPCLLLKYTVNGVEWRTACHCIGGW